MSVWWICSSKCWRKEMWSKGTLIPIQAWTGHESSRRLRLPDFKRVSIWRWSVCQPYTLAAFTPQERVLVLTSVRGWVKHRVIVCLEGLCQMKWEIPMTPSGIKPVTFQLVVQCLNQLHHHMPQTIMHTVFLKSSLEDWKDGRIILWCISRK